MIRTNEGAIEITGGISEIMADYSMITQFVIECSNNGTQLNDAEARELTKLAFNIGFCGDDKTQSITNLLGNLVSIVFCEKRMKNNGSK